MIPPHPLPVGERVRITAITADDHTAVSVWSHDANYLRNAGPTRIDSDDPNRMNFAVRPIGSPDIIGIAALKDIEWENRSAWLSIGIGPPAQRGRGLGSEAVELLVEFAFDELNPCRLGPTAIAFNQRAIATYARHGFVQEGDIREAVERTEPDTTCWYAGCGRAIGPGSGRPRALELPAIFSDLLSGFPAKEDA